MVRHPQALNVEIRRTAELLLRRPMTVYHSKIHLMPNYLFVNLESSYRNGSRLTLSSRFADLQQLRQKAKNEHLDPSTLHPDFKIA